MSHVSNIGLAASRRGSQGELWIGYDLRKRKETHRMKSFLVVKFVLSLNFQQEMFTGGIMDWL